jgi:hypothetical protein
MDTEIVIDDAFNKELDRIIEKEAKYLEDKKRDGSKYSIKKEVEIGEDFDKVLLPILKIILFKNPGLLPKVFVSSQTVNPGNEIVSYYIRPSDSFYHKGEIEGRILFDGDKIHKIVTSNLKVKGVSDGFLNNIYSRGHPSALFIRSFFPQIPRTTSYSNPPYESFFSDLFCEMIRNEYEIYKLKQQLKQQLKEQPKDIDTSIEPESDTLRDKITRIKNNKILNNRNKFYNIIGFLISEKLLDEEKYYEMDKKDIITELYPSILKDLEKTLSSEDYVFIMEIIRDLAYSSPTGKGRFTKKKSNKMRLRKTRKQSRK